MWRLLFVSLLSVSAERMDPDHMRAFRFSGHAQGTTYTITYYATDSLATKSRFDSIFARIDSSLSRYHDHSLLSRFNRSARGTSIDAHLEKVVTRALEIHRSTGGVFDITVLPLVTAWKPDPLHPGAMPDTLYIRSLLPCIGSGKIRLEGHSLVKDTSCVTIDVDGIAQGYTADVLAGFLETLGIRDYLVEIGGEIRVKGRKQPGGEMMTIGIESPSPVDTGYTPLQRKIRIEEGAVTTSGNYRKFYDIGKKRISHLLDPLTGFPVENELVSVTVVAGDAITADGYDNALMAMGLGRALTFAEKSPELEAFFIYRRPDGSIGDTATTGFLRLVVPDK